MKLQLKKGTTGKTFILYIQDATSSSGSGLKNLTATSAGLSCSYYREGAASTVLVTLASMTVGTWVSGGFVELDQANMPGFYQFGVPDAALGTGAGTVSFLLMGASLMYPVPVEVQLLDYEPASLGYIDAFFTRPFASVAGDVAEARTLLNALRLLRNKHTLSAGTLQVYREDNATSAWTGSLTTQSGAVPITGVSPT